ncbi:hypothetical protein Tco_1361975 [Tanacetum coccineum]
MTINSNLPPQIHKAQVETFEKKNVKDENLHGMDKEFETHLEGTLYIRSKSWLPRFRDLREMTMYEPYKSNYYIHSRSDKIHHNLKTITRDVGFTSTTRNTPLEMVCYSHGFIHKATKDNKQLRHDLGNRDHQKDYVNARHKPLEFQVGDKVRRGPESTWEREDQMQKKYPHLFANPAPVVDVAS